MYWLVDIGYEVLRESIVGINAASKKLNTTEDQKHLRLSGNASFFCLQCVDLLVGYFWLQARPIVIQLLVLNSLSS